MKKIWLSVFMIFFIWFGFSGQELPQLVPVSPNTAAMARFGSYSTNKNLGRANISVPIYTIKSGELELPIYIDYNSSGIRLNDRASWVGLNWSLQAGGAIIKNVKGIPDNNTFKEDITNLSFNKDNYEYLRDVVAGFSDDKPDKYIINAFGINTSFYFVKKNGVEEVFIEKNNAIKILRNNGGFTVFSENGTELIFNEKEISKIPPPTAYMSTHRSVFTAYYLSKIISLSKKDTISFQYKIKKSVEIPVISSQAVRIIAQRSIDPPDVIPVPSNNFWNKRVEIEKVYLNKIIFNNGFLEFESILDREDLKDEYRLDKIKVFSKMNNTNKLIKNIYFDYSYYSRSGWSLGYSNNNSSARSKSLKLNYLEIGSDNSNNKQKFTFGYDNGILPTRGSAKQDFWGYINNNNTSSLIPETTFTLKNGLTPITNDVEVTYGDANRDADPSTMGSGILNKITYPSGGYTKFEYEANQYATQVTVPIYNSKGYSILATGSGDCPWSTCESNGYQKLTFTIEENSYGVPFDGELRIYFTDSYTGAGSSSSYGRFNGGRDYRRSNPVGNIYPATTYKEKVFLSSGSTYTIDAHEFGHGSHPPSYTPSVSVYVSWKEPAGYKTHDVIKYVGGLRIKSIKNYNKIDSLINTKNYTYSNPNVIKEQKSGFVKKILTSGYQNLWGILSSSPHYENSIDILPAIEYGLITEYENNNFENGKIVYSYENIPKERDITFRRHYFHPQFNLSALDCMNHDNYDSSNTVCNHTLLKIDEVMNSDDDIANYIVKPYDHGSLKRVQYYKKLTPENPLESDFKIIKEIEHFYETINEDSFKVNIIGATREFDNLNWNTIMNPYNTNTDRSSFHFYYYTRNIYKGKKLLTSTKETQYDANGENPIVTEKTFTYDNPSYFLTEQTLEDSKGGILRTETTYPEDIISPVAPVQKLINLHRISEPIEVKTFKKTGSNPEKQLSHQKTDYKEWYTNGIFPEFVKTSKGTNSLEDRVIYHDYDNKGNPLEVSKKDGTKIYYVWGYNQTQPIAKIENYTSLNTTQQRRINYAMLASNNDSDRTIDTFDTSGNIVPQGLEGSLRKKLRQLRQAFPDAQVTTYTYDPLIGVTSITDPRGETIYYHYDAFNRLEYVKDAQGNILNKNEYNYKK